jgi:hypothetical protein
VLKPPQPTGYASKLKTLSVPNLYNIGQRILTHTEKINKFAEPPWHHVDDRFVVLVPPTDTGESLKESWASCHKSLLRRITPDECEVLVYTNGSLRFTRGIRLTGSGVVALWHSQEDNTLPTPVGPRIKS